MATWTAQRAGNWSRTSDNADSPWYDGGTQTGWATTPQANDAANLNAFGVSMDVTAIPIGGGSLALLTDTSATGTGNVTLALNTVGTSAINVLAITAAKKNGQGIIQVAGSTSNTLTVTGNSLGGGTGTGSSGLRSGSTGTIIIAGPCAIAAGSGSGANGIHMDVINAACVVTGSIAGAASGGPAYGYYHYGAGSLTVTGNVAGGAATDSPGIQMRDAGSATVSVAGSLTGGAGARSPALAADGSGAVTLASCNMIAGAGSVAYRGSPPTWSPGATNYIHMKANGIRFAPEVAEENLLKDVPNGLVVGTFDEAARNTDPGVANVKDGVTYKIQNSSLEGEMAAGGSALSRVRLGM